MTIDNKFLLIRNHNIFACITDENYEETLLLYVLLVITQLKINY